MKFDLYRPERKDTAGKCFPVRMNVRNEKTFIEALKYDNIGVEFKDGLRNRDCFLSSNVIIMDCDNNHSENPEDWMHIYDLLSSFWHVNYAVVESKSHNRDSNGKTPRPHFHVYFPITSCVDEREYTAFKRMLQKIFPFFDEHALPPTTYFRGIKNPDYAWNEGSKNVDEIFAEFMSLDDKTLVDNYGFRYADGRGGKSGV